MSTLTLTWSLMVQYFEVPLHVAAKELDVSQSSIKSWRRGQGLDRWPYRRLTFLRRRLRHLETRRKLDIQAMNAIDDEIRRIKTRPRNAPNVRKIARWRKRREPNVAPQPACKFVPRRPMTREFRKSQDSPTSNAKPRPPVSPPMIPRCLFRRILPCHVPVLANGPMSRIQQDLQAFTSTPPSGVFGDEFYDSLISC